MRFVERDFIVGSAVLIWGMVSTVVVAFPLNTFVNMPSWGAGIVEEPAKAAFLFILAIYFPEWLLSKKKCAVFGGLSGLGFAFGENLFYYLGFIPIEELYPEIIYVRTILCIPGHVIWSAIAGIGLYYIAVEGRAGYKKALSFMFLVMVLHGLSNAILFFGLLIVIIFFIIEILVFKHFYTKEADYSFPIGILTFQESESLIINERTFGRDDFKNFISIDNLQHISKKHFKIIRNNDTFFIEDCNSKGGTRVNGEEIRGQGRQELKRGSVISLPADLTMRFETKGDVDRVMEMHTLRETQAKIPTILNPVAKLILPNKMEIEITEKSREFGRGDFKHLISDNEISFLSRRHFKITGSNGIFYIQDLGTKNGTEVNGDLIKGTEMRELIYGDEISIANVLIIKFKLA